MSMRALPAVTLLAAFLCTSCSVGATAPIVPGASVPIPSAGKPVVYAAVGASETVGVGADIDRFRDAWPDVFYANALPRAAVLYNFGIAGETTAAALHDELPSALAVHPTLVTVWLNVDDLIAGVTPAQYGGELDELVHGLRRGGTTKVLVANIPVLDSLPLVRLCFGDGRAPGLTANCPPGIVNAGYTTARLDSQVAAYNQVIAQVVAKDGAVLVDLHAQGDVAAAHPDYVDREDGFHPSDRGTPAVAAAFQGALHGAGGP